ncbi:MAG: DUF3017 domain-containing protein [Nocardioides sp.]
MSDVDPELGPPPEDDLGRRYPSTIGGVVYLVIIAISVFSLISAWRGDWRHGVTWFGATLIAAALARLALPRRDAGMLAVRLRVVDVVLLAGTGAALIFLATTIPNQPPL